MINEFKNIKISLASPEQIRLWSKGEVKKPETINYRTLKPERQGLFCEKIFGPTKDWECYCGRYKSIRYKGIICDKCKVEVTQAKVRRSRMGHIELKAPVCHIWYLKGVPSYIAILLEMSVKSVEGIVYYEHYVVTDPGKTDFELGHIFEREEDYQAAREEHGKKFEAGIGAEAVAKLLLALNLKKIATQMKKVIAVEQEKGKDPRESKAVRRLKVVNAFMNSGNSPAWMILTSLPVIPPDLRPMVQLEGGRFATSDINDLYRRVINRNNRLERLFQLNAPEIIIRNEKRMLQEAVDALFDNGRRGRVVRGPGNRPLKSLSDLMKGKQGRFRQNLLGKRVDYSGRSVIVIDPKLKFSQCGLPKQMALELFKPFIMNKLVERGRVHNIRSAKKMIERSSREVWDVLEEIITNHPVLLNRAPTLHRLGIQAFDPVLIEGKAIRLHPLVCTAFNADFDGDQMAVHVPLSKLAQLEARFLMMSTNNLLLPGNGHPVAIPTQDMVIGLYYLTVNPREGEKIEREKLRYFTDEAELQMALDGESVGLHDTIEIRWRTGERIRTTVGRAIFNFLLPPEMPFHNEALGKKRVGKLVAACFESFGSYTTIKLLDLLKNIGFTYATRMGCSIGIDDVLIPPEKDEVLKEADKEASALERSYLRGEITDDERYNRVVDIWSRTGNRIRDILYGHLKQDQNGFNPVYLMSTSGARGSVDQIKQLGGMRGLMAKPSGKIIELPIKANFREGLTVLEYFISTHGARKGLADTALKTSDAGYLTRRLSDVAQEVIVYEDDCGTIKGITVTALREGDEERESLYDRILGRVALDDITHPETGDKLVSAGEEITEVVAAKVEDAGVEKVRIRTVLTCEAAAGVCILCYGRNMATGKLVEPGEPVGIIAAQSIGEPGTQLTMRTFHIGGIAMSGGFKEAKYPEPVMMTEIPEKVVKRDNDVIVMRQSPVRFRRVKEEVKVPEGARILAAGVFVQGGDPIMEVKSPAGAREKVTAHTEGIMMYHEKKNRLLVLGREQTILLPAGAVLKVVQDELLPPNELIAAFDPFNEPILCERSGKVAWVDLRAGRTMREDVDENTGMSVRVVTEDKEKELQPRLVIKVRAAGEEAGGEDIYDLPYLCQLAVKDGDYVRAGDNLAKIPSAISKTKDITGGLPRVEDLFEARQRPDRATVAEIDGAVHIQRECKKSGHRLVTVKGKVTKKEYYLPYGLHLKVKSGDRIEAGTPLTDGPVSPYDILKVKGMEELQKYLVNEVQEVYRSQGVTIADKHIEVIIRQMLRKALITDAGDANALVGSLVDRRWLDTENRAVKAKGKKPAKFEPMLLGITKSALATESFISASSFQETRRILAEAAINGAQDYLRGLKENVVIGHLIPAGTGMKRYHERAYEPATLPARLAEQFKDLPPEAVSGAACEPAPEPPAGE